MARNLQGMGVVITGASSGIGLALARALCAAGARVALCARRLDRLELLRAELPGVVLVRQVDVADEVALRAFVVEAASVLGRLDVAIANAGQGLLRPAAATGEAAWRSLLAVNVLGSVSVLESAVAIMRGQEPRQGWRGQVLLISSCLARRGVPTCAAYCASKAAQLSLAEAARCELADERIHVGSVHPIGTATEFFDQAEARSGTQLSERVPLRQPVERVARAVLAGIRRPRPEIWTAWWARLAFGVMGLLPRLVDVALRRVGRRLSPGP